MIAVARAVEACPTRRHSGGAQARWIAVALAVLVLHTLPLALINLPRAAPMDEPPLLFTLNLSEMLEPAEPAPEDALQPADVKPANAKPVEKMPAHTESVLAAIPAALPAPAAPVSPPMPAEKPAPAAPPDAEPAPPEKKQGAKLVEIELQPFSKPSVAFDESKSTPNVPKDAYLSDRNSTAADRGPKHLPRGDPFMDKGESGAIRYQKKRGEDNLPPLASDAAAGSVQKAGTPEAGKGALDLAKPPDTVPPAARVPPATSPLENAHAPVIEKKEAAALLPSPAAGVPPARTAGVPPAIPTASSAPAISPLEDGLDAPGTAPAIEKSEAALPPPPAVASLESGRDARGIAQPLAVAGGGEQNRFTAPLPVADRRAQELAAFKALLEDGPAPSKDGRGGDAGDKSGIQGRPGQKGHEGNGIPRPGDDDAVSDVTTVNLNSSAAESDEARFGKKFDAKTAYVKPLARRIDGKWKAEVVSRSRVRVVAGSVAIKVVVGRDGTLLEASEVSRTAGVPDECAAIAKRAVQLAADPRSEPFPSELQGRVKLEFVFNFLY